MWKTVKIKEVASFVRGLTYSKKDETEHSKTAVLRATNIDLTKYSLTFNEIRYISENVKVKPEKYAQKGDILICTASGSKSHLGKVALVESDLGMAFGGFMAAIRSSKECLPKYLFMILISPRFVYHLQSLADGANINNLKFSQFEDYQFCLPPLAEQHKIVEKLDRAFAEIDRAIEATKLKQEEVKALTSAVLAQELNSSDLAKTVKLGDVLELIQNGINCDQDKSGSGVKITRIETIADANINFNKTGFAHLSDAQKARAKLEKGDILFSHINSAIHVGKTAIYNGEEDLFHGINLLRMRPTPYVDSYYLNLFLKSLFWSGYWRTACKQSVNQASVNQTDIKSISFSFPPLAEQLRIVEKLDQVFSSADEAWEAFSNQLDHYKKLKSAILAQELKGPES